MNGPEVPETPLSPDHIGVLELVVEGWTDERIARELGLSFSSVRRRLKEAAKILGANSRVQLAVRAVEGGLVSRTGRGQSEGEPASAAELDNDALKPDGPSSTEGGTGPAT